MSRIKIINSIPVTSFDETFLTVASRIWSGWDDVQTSSTSATLTITAENSSITFTGTGLAFDPSGHPTGGTLTGISIVVGGVAFLDVSNFSVPAVTFAAVADDGNNDALIDLFKPVAFTGGAGSDIGIGSSGIDILKGMAGDDILVGGAGGDTLDGGARTDGAGYLYHGAVTASLADPSKNTGDAAGDVYVSIEALVGSAFGDMLEGDNAANYLLGQDGGDTLSGLDGDDLIVGGKGDDIIVGGKGADWLIGGGGKDTFVYRAIAQSTVDPLNQDLIENFNANASDFVDVSRIDAIAGGANDAFTFIGDSKFTGLGQVRAYDVTGGVMLSFNISGSKAPEMLIKLEGTTLAAVGADDLIL